MLRDTLGHSRVSEVRTDLTRNASRTRAAEMPRVPFDSKTISGAEERRLLGPVRKHDSRRECMMQPGRPSASRPDPDKIRQPLALIAASSMLAVFRLRRQLSIHQPVISVRKEDYGLLMIGFDATLTFCNKYANTQRSLCFAGHRSPMKGASSWHRPPEELIFILCLRLCG